MASRECHDSVNSLKKFVKKTKEIVDENSDNIVLALPSRFNKIYINQERLFLLSKNLHHIVSQQIDIAVYDAKEFNSWLDMYEKLPEVIYRNNMETIKLELKTKEEVIKEYLADLDNFVCNMGECIKNNVCVIQLRLLRPALALLHKDGELEKMMSDGVLDKKLEQEAINYLELNSLL
jgi:hypothetical protein